MVGKDVAKKERMKMLENYAPSGILGLSEREELVLITIDRWFPILFFKDKGFRSEIKYVLDMI